LEVGAGLGVTACWLSEQVGAQGRVIATDIDTRFLEPMRAGHHIDNLEVWTHDICRDPLPECAFDLIHARWLFYHLPEPEAVIARLLRALRPGGTILVEDVDFFPVHQAASKPYAQFMLALARAVGARVGHGGEWAAAAIPRLFGAPLWTELSVDAELDILRGASRMAEFWTLTARQMHDHLLSDPDCDQETLEVALKCLADPEFWSYSTAQIAVSARRAERG
jgi:SAM-dependent methyltransferase